MASKLEEGSYSVYEEYFCQSQVHKLWSLLKLSRVAPSFRTDGIPCLSLWAPFCSCFLLLSLTPNISHPRGSSFPTIWRCQSALVNNRLPFTLHIILDFEKTAMWQSDDLHLTKQLLPSPQWSLWVIVDGIISYPCLFGNVSCCDSEWWLLLLPNGSSIIGDGVLCRLV